MAYNPINSNGQATMANSTPIVIASDQSIISTIDPDVSVSGTITAADIVVGTPSGTGTLLTGTSTAGSTVALACPGGDSAWVIQVIGTFGGTTIYWEASVDSTNGSDGNWIAINGRQTGIVNTVLSNNTTVAGFFRGNTSGISYLRIRAIGGATISVSAKLRISSGSGAIFLNASIPAGTNIIGKIGIDQTTPGTTNLVALAANQSINNAQVNGVATSTGTGIMGTGTQRITIASDNDALTVKQTTAANLNATVVGTGTFAVQAASTLAAETTKVIGTVNIAASQTVAAVTAITNALPIGANVIGKVTIDQTTPGTTNLVALAANQSVNNTQIGGVTMSVGNGVTGTGSQRVTIASDNTAFSVNATLTANAAPHNIGVTLIHKDAVYSTTQTTTILWTPTAGKKFVVTDISINTGGTITGIVTLYDAASATAYAAGTTPAIWRGEFAPSTTTKPGLIKSFNIPYVSTTINNILFVTTSAAINPLYIQLNGYEI